MAMTIVFLLAAIYCTVLGFIIWFFPKLLIKFNDWLTEKTLLQHASGTFYRLIMGAIFLIIAGIFWWSILSP